MSVFFIINFKLFTAFCVCYMLTKLSIKYFFKDTSFSTKYLSIKLVPVLWLSAMGINLYKGGAMASGNSVVSNSFSEFPNAMDIVTVNDNVGVLLSLLVKCFLYIWVAGMVVLLIRYSVEFFCFRRVYRRSQLITSSFLCEKLAKCKNQLGVSRHVNIYYGINADAPFTFGIFRPKKCFWNICFQQHFRQLLIIRRGCNICSTQSMAMRRKVELYCCFVSF